MKILLTFDSPYAPHAAVVIESIIQYCPQKLDFVILHTIDLEENHRNQLFTHFQERVNSFQFYEIPLTEFKPFKNLTALKHIKNPQSVLLRLFCDHLPFDDILIYVDCDILVFEDITKILNYMHPDEIIGAVTEYNGAYKEKDLSNIQSYEKYQGDPLIYESYYSRTLKKLEMNPYGRYFCAGMMVINLKLWRENKISSKTLNYILTNPDKCFATDQDALNHFINGNYIEIPPRWNNVVMYGGVFTNYSLEELKEAYFNPAIVHFAGTIKPWHYMANKKYKKTYRDYRKKTPWPRLIYQDKNFLNFTKRNVLFPLAILLRKLVGNTFLSALGVYKKKNRFWAQSRL